MLPADLPLRFYLPVLSYPLSNSFLSRVMPDAVPAVQRAEGLKQLRKVQRRVFRGFLQPGLYDSMCSDINGQDQSIERRA